MHIPPFAQLITTLTDKGALANLKNFLADERQFPFFFWVCFFLSFKKKKTTSEHPDIIWSFFVKRLAWITKDNSKILPNSIIN